MSKVLVIPDTHLKPKMFDLADKIMRENEVDYAIQLGDNVDDFYCYAEEYCAYETRAVKFYHDHPEMVWLWGNHEIAYLSGQLVTGNTIWGEQFAKGYERNFNPEFVHLDGKVIFSHAGIFQEFIDDNNLNSCTTAEELIRRINRLDMLAFWSDDSPVWARPQYSRLTSPTVLNNYLQIVGHTPVKDIVEENGVVSVDTFSTDWGKKISIEKMIIVDTEEPSFKIVNIDYREAFGEKR